MTASMFTVHTNAIRTNDPETWLARLKEMVREDRNLATAILLLSRRDHHADEVILAAQAACGTEHAAIPLELVGDDAAE